jgi:hypothetical protein
VWGTGIQSQLTTDTREVLERPSGLMDGSINLSQTVKDAIQVTRDLGLRYIWIDALCILQDDAEDKASIVSQMASIYGNCTIAIVASTNTDPSDGLPGVSAVSRSEAQIVENIQGMSLAAVFHDPRIPYTEIEKSVWNSRAWTFQERHLAKRSVYFTKNQLCFTCPHGTAFEDTLPVPDPAYKPVPLNEQTKMTGQLHRLQSYLWADPTQNHYPNKAFGAEGEDTVIWMSEDPDNPGKPSPGPTPVYRYAAAPNTEVTGQLRFDGETLWKTYSDAVSYYTQRNMSRESDIINAFTGVADLISQGVNTKFWYGIPEFAFDQALLWQPREALKRRAEDNGAFPSWSWAAWKGHCSYRGRGWYNAINYRPVSVVEWHHVIEDLEWYIQRYKEQAERTPEEIDAFTQRVTQPNVSILMELDPDRLYAFDNANDGWKIVRDETRNEHIYVHDSYPGLRFSYPVLLSGQPLLERPSADGTLYFGARAAAVRFCDMPNTEFIQESLQDEFLQIGLNDEAQSANYRRPWQHIIYHQGYRAGFLSLNVPFSEIDLAEQDDYQLLAMSRDSVSHIAPPALGWDKHWEFSPHFIQKMCYIEEWGDRTWEIDPPDFSTKPDTSKHNENGDPKWDLDRFGGVAICDVYNVLLVRMRKTGYYERVGVGKINFRAFCCAKPKKRLIKLR